MTFGEDKVFHQLGFSSAFGFLSGQQRKLSDASTASQVDATILAIDLLVYYALNPFYVVMHTATFALDYLTPL